MFLITLLLLTFLCYIELIVTINSRYDKSINLFSSDGELIQVLYAEIAGRKGANVIAQIFKDEGILVTIENIENTDILLDRRTIDKIAKINENIWLTFSGLSGDGRYIIINARSFCNEYNLKFGIMPSISAVAKHIGDLQHRATITGNERPLGVNIILFGIDTFDDANGKPKVYSIKPSGQVIAWKVHAIGNTSDKLMKWLETNYKNHDTIEESINNSINCIESTNSLTENNITRKYDLYYLSKNIQSNVVMKIASYTPNTNSSIEWKLRDDLNRIYNVSKPIGPL